MTLDDDVAALLADLTHAHPSREERFDRIARLAAATFDVPAAIVNLLDEQSQFHKGCVGLDLGAPLPLRDTFCQYVLLSGRHVYVPDLTADPRFAGHPIVTEDGYRSYFGHPLRIRGHVVGTLCLLDRSVRVLDADEQDRLADLAALAENELLLADAAAGSRGAVLRTLHKRDELILQFVDTAICGLDHDGFVTFANPRAAELLGTSLDLLVGCDFTEMFHYADAGGAPRTWADSPIATALRTGVTQRVSPDVLYSARAGRIEVEYAAAPLVIDSEVLGVVVTLADISDRRAVERLKAEFVSVVSHELRTPLTSIRGSLGLLNSGKFGELEAQGARLIQIALDNTERLVRLVNDILDLERMEAGRADLHTRVQPLAPMLAAARDAVAGAAGEAGIEVVLPDSTAAYVEADSDFLVRAVVNLLGNAIKFSAPGGAVTVAVHTDSAEVHLSIADTGRGIPSSRLSRIFERFEQADLSDSRDKGGSGLGLAITRGIVELHGGRVDVASELGVGSTFTITLPAVPAIAAREAGPDAVGAPTVVLVEDDDDLVEVLTAALRAEGYHVASARGVDEAVGLVTRLHPTLLVLDVQLADGQGYDVVQRLRADPVLGETPVLIATAYEMDDEKIGRLALGPTTVIVKGTVGADLVRSVVAEVGTRLRPAEPNGAAS
ncbi:MAG: ATP-binding protein [Sporichthyaceae bacterium]